MESEYASNAKGNTGVTLGAVALGTSVLNWIHGGGILGGGNAAAQAANTTVAYEMAKKDSEIAQLKADAATDAKLVQVYTELRKQDKEQDAKISDLNTRVTSLETAAPLREQIVLSQVQSVASAVAGIQNTLSGITKCVVPNSSVCPGWGNVTITPATTTTAVTA